MNDAISKLQRYDLIGCDSDIHIGPESCGDYVKYADVQAALQHAGQGEPVAWISEIQCLGAGIYGKRLYGALPIQSLQPGYYKHIPLYKHPQPAVQHAGQGEAARETLASWMLSRGFSTGHGESVTDLLAELDGQITQPAVPEWIELIEGQPEVDKIAVLHTPLCGPLKGVPLYTRPQPAVPDGWIKVMRGMAEYAECNDPRNPYLQQAQALLSAGKEKTE